MIEKEISLHLNSNKPKDFKNLIDSIRETSFEINKIEIIVHIDKNDSKMKNTIDEINSISPTLISYLETDMIKNFSDAWKPLNLLLKKTSETVKVISCISDDLRFVTNNWDRKILSYDSQFNDKIYRLRCSKFKNQNYKDIWQCGYAPDSYAFYSRNWLININQWCPCIGPDSFQECISFYMTGISKEFNRNIICEEISFDGQNISTGLDLKTRLKRTRIYYKAFFSLMSYKNQSLALQYAKKIIKNLENFDAKTNLDAYKINYISHCFKNFIRRFNFFKYRGSPDHPINSIAKNVIFMIWCYLNFLDFFLLRIIKFSYNRGILKKIIKNKEQFQNIEKAINYE